MFACYRLLALAHNAEQRVKRDGWACVMVAVVGVFTKWEQCAPHSCAKPRRPVPIPFGCPWVYVTEGLSRQCMHGIASQPLIVKKRGGIGSTSL